MYKIELLQKTQRRLSEESFNSCSSLWFIGALATRYNVVDVAEAERKKITVCNVPA